jgi:hypothetical protein
MPVVGAAVAVVAALSSEPIPAKVLAACETASGTTLTNDIDHLPPEIAA